MTTLLPASLQKTLRDIAERSNQRGASVRAILLSTTEGVPLGRVIADASLNEGGLASIESVWAPASAPASVLGLDKVKQVTAIYDHGTLVHIYEASMVVTILCGAQSNLGAVRSTAIPLLKQVLEPLSRELVNSLQPETSSSFPVATYYQ